MLRWRNSALSRQRLGYPETVRQLERTIGRCDPANRERFAAALASARNGVGSTAFDWLVEIIRDHGEGGDQAEDRVMLELL